jgi:hypothetical protein
MERRSRSQTRRQGEGQHGAAPAPGPPGPAQRHASSSRLPEVVSGHAALSFRAPEQARTLSPDRRDRYRASGRGYQGEAGPASLPPPRPEPQGSVPHSNSNSYNQYNHAQFPVLTNGYGELPPPRPHPPYGGAGAAPPRPEPPAGYQPAPSLHPAPSTALHPAPAPSPSKPSGAEQKPAGGLGQVHCALYIAGRPYHQRGAGSQSALNRRGPTLDNGRIRGGGPAQSAQPLT